MLFTSNLKFLSSIYLSIVLHSNLVCFNMGLPSFGSRLIGLLQVPDLLSPRATGVACTAPFMASAVCVMVSVIAARIVTKISFFLHILLRLPCFSVSFYAAYVCLRPLTIIIEILDDPHVMKLIVVLDYINNLSSSFFALIV